MKKHFNKSLIFAVIILMDLLVGMEFDLFTPSFPQLQSHFNLTPFLVEALISVNFIGYCISLFFVGKLADRYGRKYIILVGLVTFIIGSVLCLHKKLFYFLLIGRLLQGIGIAAPSILSFLIIADIYSVKEQQFLMAILNASMNTAVAAAPVLGSYIALFFNWEGNFAVLLIFGFVVLLLTSFFIPSQSLQKKSGGISNNDYSEIFRSKPLMLLIMMMLVNFVPYWIFVGMSPLLYIKDFGVSLHYFGFFQGSLALIFALGSLLFGFMIKNKNQDQKKMLVISNMIFIASLIFILILTAYNSRDPFMITLAMIVFVIAQIIPGALLTPITLNFIPRAKARVSAIMQGGRLILTAAAVQTVGFFYAGEFRSVGIMIGIFILMTVILLFCVISTMKRARQQASPIITTTAL